MGCIMGCVIGLIIVCTHDRVSMSDLSTLTAVGNKVDTKIQNCVWDVRRFSLLTNLVIYEVFLTKLLICIFQDDPEICCC